MTGNPHLALMVRYNNTDETSTIVYFFLPWFSVFREAQQGYMPLRKVREPLGGGEDPCAEHDWLPSPS